MRSNCRPLNSNFISWRFTSLLTLERKPLSLLTCFYWSLYTGSRFCFWSSFCTLGRHVAAFASCSNLRFHCFGVYCMTGLKYSDVFNRRPCVLADGLTHSFQIFISPTWRSVIWRLRILTEVWLVLEHQYHYHGVTRKGCFKHFVSLNCWFLKFEAKFDTNSVFCRVCRCTGLRWSENKLITDLWSFGCTETQHSVTAILTAIN